MQIQERRLLLNRCGPLLAVLSGWLIMHVGSNHASAWDQIFADDVIINGGSLGVGFDVVNGEAFGADTIRLKENNLRIHFDDTSTSSGFPNNDWRIVANDNISGGDNHFSIQDSTAVRVPFRIEAGARTNALVVDSNDRIGIGTKSPVVLMHAVDGNTPTLRLEQDGSSGFSSQTFDIASNEENFFIRDVTNASNLVLRIKPGAPANSLYIRNDGNVGLGTAAPVSPLHVIRNADTPPRIATFAQNRQDKAMLVTFENLGSASVNNSCGFDYQLKDDSSSPQIAMRQVCSLIDTSAGAATAAFQFQVLNNGSTGETMRIVGNRVSIGSTASTDLLRVLNATCNGATWNDACSRELKQNITDLSTDAAKEALAGLNPVTYAYKADPQDQRVGFVAEDAPELVGMPEKKTLCTMDIVAVLTKVVKEQEQQLADQEQELERLRSGLAAEQETVRRQQEEFLNRLDALEARMHAR